MNPTYPLYMENCSNLGDFDGDLHGHLRDRMRENPLFLQETAIAVLETFSDRYFGQIGPYYNPLVYVGVDVKLDLHLHCRTILRAENLSALELLLMALKSATGAVYVRFLYGDFPGDCTIAQWDFSRRSWTFDQPRGERP